MKLFRKKPPGPTEMNVDLALFRGDDLICRGTVNITDAPASSQLSVGDDTTLLVSHAFALPACSVSLQLRRGKDEANAERLLEAALEMGVHESDDWESVALGPDYTLGFFCRPVS